MKWIKRNEIQINDDDLLIDKLAQVRGIKYLDGWINPPSKYVYSPYLLENIDRAVQRIVKAIHTDEVIQIVADIDTDGVCSTGTMYNYLSEVTDQVSYVHAQRSKGHGVEKVLDKIEDSTSLVIIVDSSSNSVEGCKALVDRGKDIVIIDHHEVDVENPYAILVNCQLGDYPNKNLSGSAMCYKVCQVLDEYLGIELADDFLDLCAVGLVGDLMSVKNLENRYLIYNGINKIDNIGIKEILNQSNIDYSEGISTTNISYKIAPIIGACSRFDKIELALELVTTMDADRAKLLTKQMIEMNEQRKTDQKKLVEELIDSMESGAEVSQDYEPDKLIMIVDNSIDSGFRGLIATEIVEKYSRPVFVLSEFYDEQGKVYKYAGSARSVGLIKLKSLCQESGLFNFATGHEQAFGIEFKAENLESIKSYFNMTLSNTDLQKVIEYDLELNVNDIDEIDIKQVEKFGKISGQGFPEPKFLIKGITVEEGYTKKLGNHVRAVMGKNNDTVKINCENNFALMKFRTNDQYAIDIEQHFNDEDNFCTELEVVGSLNINKFYNRGLREWVVTKQVFVEDYRIVE